MAPNSFDGPAAVANDEPAPAHGTTGARVFASVPDMQVVSMTPASTSHPVPTFDVPRLAFLLWLPFSIPPSYRFSDERTSRYGIWLCDCCDCSVVVAAWPLEMFEPDMPARPRPSPKAAQSIRSTRIPRLRGVLLLCVARVRDMCGMCMLIISYCQMWRATGRACNGRSKLTLALQQKSKRPGNGWVISDSPKPAELLMPFKLYFPSLILAFVFLHFQEF